LGKVALQYIGENKHAHINIQKSTKTDEYQKEMSSETQCFFIAN